MGLNLETTDTNDEFNTNIPLYSSTLEIDSTEGDYINNLKSTNTEAISEPLVSVPDDLKRNLAVTSIDALLNWGRKSSVFPLSFGLAFFLLLKACPKNYSFSSSTLIKSISGNILEISL